MSTSLRTATVTISSVLLLLGIAACQGSGGAEASADDDGGGTHDAGEGEQAEFGDLYYLSSTPDGTGSTLFRWDGTEGGEVETVLDGAGLAFRTLNVSTTGDYVSWASSADDGSIEVLNTETDEQRRLWDYPVRGDFCFVPTWSSDGRPQLLVPGDGNSTQIYNVDSDTVGDAIDLPNICNLYQATGSQTDSIDIYHFDYDTGDIGFTTASGETVLTGIGAAVSAALGVGIGGMSAISGSGAHVCVILAGNETPGPARELTCDAVVDVATGEVVKEAGQDRFQVRWHGESMVERSENTVSYYPSSDEAGGEPALTVPEPAELAGAELIAMTG